ncbi:polysaccharide biosynthesis protein [Vulcanococcus limneticus]|uniref:polysaccharide biosynthesis protein n=1 Tax=Vulcanococcus limneticus TaxID=2170428 RepID=UPI00398BCEA2
MLIRRTYLVTFDGLLILAAFYGAFALRLHEKETLTTTVATVPWLPWLALVSGLPVLLFSGWYRGLTRYAGSHSLYGLIPRGVVMVLVLLMANTLLGGAQPPRSFWVLYLLLFSGGAISSRIVLRDVLVSQLERNSNKRIAADKTDATLIYGAGHSGMNLLNAIRSDRRFRIIGFLDDDTQLHGRTLQNLKIHSPTRLHALIKDHGLNKVLLAMPSLSRERKRLLVDQLSHLGLEVLSIPSLSQLANGQRIVSDIQAVLIEDLLGREPSKPLSHLLQESVNGKCVLVTGAGGSIGSELCRQILALGARKLLLLDLNEYVLYSIDKELSSQKADSEIRPILGDASDANRLTLICREHRVQTIFHAAAYKHVPLVEANLCAGIANNLRATKSVIQAAIEADVERLTLISTDKAVRPTNAMGASKRVCELLIQAAAADLAGRQPVMAMVRFGNVLGSSGSVIPLFHEQISKGGPITVTHQAITRYFMTIPEAVQLVLQATGMARGGELFLLDMGEPVRIAELARQMIELSGLRVRDEQNPNGDIAIEYTGLRPGEKLYEELLISARDEATQHPLIRKAKEPNHSSSELEPMVEALEKALDRWDEQATIMALSRLVPEYNKDRKVQPTTSVANANGVAPATTHPASPKLPTAP